MRHRKAGRHLGRSTGHRLALYRNLMTELFRHERIKTTEAKARAVRPLAERLVEDALARMAAEMALHARRQVLAELTDKDIANKLVDEIAPRFEERPGGYTRMFKLGARAGDAAKMALLELVE
jgi:large subunit ribosomal protein L17